MSSGKIKTQRYCFNAKQENIGEIIKIAKFGGNNDLKKSCFSQVLCNDNVCYGLKDKLDVVGVCSTCDVCVYSLSTWVSVQSHKLVS